jgi:hypothetical protein
MPLDVLANPAWRGLRHADEIEGVLLMLRIIFLFSGLPIGVAAVEEA